MKSPVFCLLLCAGITLPSSFVLAQQPNSSSSTVSGSEDCGEVEINPNECEIRQLASDRQQAIKAGQEANEELRRIGKELEERQGPDPLERFQELQQQRRLQEGTEVDSAP